MAYNPGGGAGQAGGYYNNGAYNPNGYSPGYNSGYNPQQQQPGSSYPMDNYAPPAQPPPGPPPPGYGEKSDFEQTFKIDKPKYNDLWAGILFLAVVAGFVVVSAISLHGYASEHRYNGGGIYDGVNDVGLSTNTVVLFMFVLLCAFFLSYGYVGMARMFPKQFIWITGILNIVFGLVTAIYMIYRKAYAGGILFLVFVAFLIFAFISWIPRIPFSALMLKQTITVSKKYGHVYLVSLLGGLLATALAAWYAVTFVAVYVKFQPGQSNPSCRNGGCSSAKVTGLIVFITFAMYWISEFLKNTVHTSISGIYGSWYFNPHNPPRGATRGALKRSLTYSFGSISFGSLIVAIINLLRQFCSMAQSNAAADGNIFGSIMFCILGCLIGLLEWAVQFVNRYAFSYIALYGKPYLAAAKATWTMIKQRGIDALVNECLIGPVLTMGATFVAYACALLSYLFLVFTHPAYNRDGSYTAVVVAFSFLIGLQICHIFTTPISSGIDTIFVAMAWEPEVLMREHPELYAEMVHVYPQVQVALHA